MSNVLFTVIEDEKLVEMVAKLYKNQTIKDNAWKEVAEQVNRSVEDCKKRWRNIKDTYLKMVKKGMGTGSSASSKPKHWPLADMLTFLGKADYKRDSISNIECGEEVEDDDSSTEINDDLQVPSEEINNQSICSIGKNSNEDATLQTSKSQNPLKSKRQKYNEKVIQLLEDMRIERNYIMRNMAQNREDDIDLFFKSIAMSVKKLNPASINEVKMKSLQMVFELESYNTFVKISQYSPAPSTSFSSQSLESVDVSDYGNVNEVNPHYEPNYEQL